MNSVKIVYIFSVMLSEMFYLIMAVLIPVHITPGQYWWTAGFIVLVFIQAVAFGNRLDNWEWRK